jgi:hypothetical protein
MIKFSKIQLLQGKIDFKNFNLSESHAIKMSEDPAIAP